MRYGYEFVPLSSFVFYNGCSPVHSGSVYAAPLPASAGLFEKGARGVIVVDNPLSQAQKQDVCFIEAEDITPYRDSVESWIIYRWNRRYPADTWFSIDLHEDWKLAEITEFAGYSHEKITKEIYTR